MNAVASENQPAHTLSRWQRWVLPAVIGTENARRDAEGGTDVPRSPRDWAVDVVMFGFAFLTAVGTLLGDHRGVGATLLVIDAVLGVPACLLVWGRRRHPVGVAWLALGLALISESASGASIVALFTVAVHCPPRRTAQAAGLSVLGAAIRAGLYTQRSYAYGALAFSVVAIGAVVGFGLFVRARRDLLLSLRDRAHRAEDEQHLRVREAQLAERARIAREMHDVLAHRISLLSVHAGALEFNPHASPEEIARAAGVIRVSARAAQEELREVIGVLRAGTELEDVQPPQPTMVDLPTLVEESRAAGMDVSFKDALEERSLSQILGRTVYRVVQEALTNARKHAAGQVVTITLGGDRSSGVTVEVVNRPWVGQADATATEHGADADFGAEHVGAGVGLVGLTERVNLVGGELSSEQLAGGGFRLRVTLPWSDPETDEEEGA